MFTRRKIVVPENTAIYIEGHLAEMRKSMKYLGLTIDRNWKFNDHFDRIIPKAVGMAASLMRLMPNLRGPEERRRRLYANTVNSVIMYGAPIWADAITKNRFIRENLRRIQRCVSLRVISAYRTVSHEAAAVLARQIPLDILAQEHARVYNRTCAAREKGLVLTDRQRSGLRNMERAESVSEWKRRLEEGADRLPGATARECVVPILSEWINKRKGLGVTFRVTQVVTGHGCFNLYLYNIDRADSPVCAHCGSGMDTAGHTLLECSSWATQREQLYATFDRDFTLKSIFGDCVAEPSKWATFRNFCERTIKEKERQERERQRAAGTVRRARPPRARIRLLKR